MLTGFRDKRASLVSVFAFCSGENDDEVSLFQEAIDGIIVMPRGHLSYGWERCFQPIKSDKTYAELTQSQQRCISPRMQALAQVKEHILIFGYY